METRGFDFDFMTNVFFFFASGFYIQIPNSVYLLV